MSAGDAHGTHLEPIEISVPDRRIPLPVWPCFVQMLVFTAVVCSCLGGIFTVLSSAAMLTAIAVAGQIFEWLRFRKPGEFRIVLSEEGMQAFSMTGEPIRRKGLFQSFSWSEVRRVAVPWCSFPAFGVHLRVHLKRTGRGALLGGWPAIASVPQEVWARPECRDALQHWLRDCCAGAAKIKPAATADIERRGRMLCTGMTLCATLVLLAVVAVCLYMPQAMTVVLLVLILPMLYTLLFWPPLCLLRSGAMADTWLASGVFAMASVLGVWLFPMSLLLHAVRAGGLALAAAGGIVLVLRLWAWRSRRSVVWLAMFYVALALGFTAGYFGFGGVSSQPLLYGGLVFTPQPWTPAGDAFIICSSEVKGEWRDEGAPLNYVTWYLADGEKLRTAEIPGVFRATVINKDMALVTSGRLGDMRLSVVPRQNEPVRELLHGPRIGGTRASPNGRWVVAALLAESGATPSWHLHDLYSGETRSIPLQRSEMPVLGVVVKDDGTLLILRGRTKVKREFAAKAAEPAEPCVIWRTHALNLEETSIVYRASSVWNRWRLAPDQPRLYIEGPGGENANYRIIDMSGEAPVEAVCKKDAFCHAEYPPSPRGGCILVHRPVFSTPFIRTQTGRKLALRDMAVECWLGAAAHGLNVAARADARGVVRPNLGTTFAFPLTEA